MIKNLLLISSLFTFSNFALAVNYTLDAAHSGVSFKVKHLMISNVSGTFKEFKGRGAGTFSKDEAKIDSLHMEISAASIDTNNAKRDGHLRDKDFFNTDQFKTITFDSTKVEYNGKIPSKIHGNLSLRGVTKPVVFDVEWGGYLMDSEKKEKIAFDAETTIMREDFGIVYNKALETGGFAIGKDVKVKVSVEATRDAEVASATPVKNTTKKN